MNELLKRCHSAHLKVLEDFSNICERHNLKWYAFCGTLLGAVRHKGFIPWDDDLDICMMRADYNSFFNYAKKEMPDYHIETYDSYTPEESRYHNFNGITRINNTFVANFNEEFMAKFCEFPYSVGIDLYPLDYVSKDKKTYDAVTSIFNYLVMVSCKYKSLNWSNYPAPELPPFDLETAYKQIYKSTGVRINTKGDVLRQLNDIAVKIATYTKAKDSNNVACIMHTAFESKNMIFPKSAFRSQLKVQFENREIYIPGGYDEILKINYGDYMTPKKSTPHDFPYYKFEERWVMNFIIHNPGMAKHIPKFFIEDVYEEQKEILDKIYGGIE